MFAPTLAASVVESLPSTRRLARVGPSTRSITRQGEFVELTGVEQADEGRVHETGERPLLRLRAAPSPRPGRSSLRASAR